MRKYLCILSCQTYLLSTHLHININKFIDIFFEINISFRTCFTKRTIDASKELRYGTRSRSELKDEKFNTSLLCQPNYSKANFYTLPTRNRKSGNELCLFYL